MENMNTYTLVIYSHTDFLDILKIQDHYIRKVPNIKKVLFINQTDINLSSFGFDQIIHYNDQLNYTKKVASCLDQAGIQTKYIIFMHDNDILLTQSPDDIHSIIKLMNAHNIDRVDFGHILNSYMGYHDLQPTCVIPYRDDIGCHLHKYIYDQFHYNVNPSIWNTQKYHQLVNSFNYNYRQVECQTVNDWCKYHLNMYRLISDDPVESGYYMVTPVFIYLHITAAGKMLPVANNNVTPWIQSEYEYILANFEITKGFREDAVMNKKKPK